MVLSGEVLTQICLAHKAISSGEKRAWKRGRRRTKKANGGIFRCNLIKKKRWKDREHSYESMLLVLPRVGYFDRNSGILSKCKPSTLILFLSPDEVSTSINLTICNIH